MRRGLRGLAGGLLVLLAACAVGETREATHVTDVTARLRGLVRSTVAGPTDYWFEYGTTTAYGSATATQTIDVPDSQAYTVIETVDELREGTEYHYRLCATDVDGSGLCGEDRTFTTTEKQDSVVGEGTLTYSPSTYDFSWTIAIDATGDRSGGPASGQVSTSTRLGTNVGSGGGPVTCLRIEGDRAAVGFRSTTTTYGVVFLGAFGNLVAFGSLTAPGTDCPDPATAQFVAISPFLGFPPIVVGPGLSSGGFTFHNHSPPN